MRELKGIFFPFRKGKTSFPEQGFDEDLIRQSILQIILTTRGERVMRPDFGSNIFSLVFENASRLTEEMIKTEVRSALSKYEPRIIIQRVTVSSKESLIDVELDYVIITSKREQKLNVNFNRP